MLKFLALFASIGALALMPVLSIEETLLVPRVSAAEPSTLPEAEHALPVLLSIPSIKLSSPVVPLGVDALGNMDVPSGKTKNVGWYKNGTIPGQSGSAVLDAHVYAAFKNLHKVKIGQDIYVEMENGMKLHFKITSKKVYPLSQVPNDELFNKSDGHYLHLITCAGTFSKKLNTYTERLLVYAKLVE